MLLSVVIVIPALFARYKLADSPLFERLKQRQQLAASPSLSVFKMHGGPIILLALVVAFMSMDGFVMGTYFISFMRFAGLPLATIAVILMLGRVADALGVLLSGPFADFCKRKTVAYIAIGLTTLLSYPFVLAVLSKRILLMMALQIPISFLGIGVLHGLAPILASESFPTKFRYSGTGISYNLCHIFGGMIAPSVLAGLIGRDVFHKWHYVPACYVLYCIVAMLALFFIRETRDVNLEYLDHAEPAPAFSARLQEVVPN
jgi:MFS family permease